MIQIFTEIFNDAIVWFKNSFLNKEDIKGWGDSRVDENPTIVNTAEAILGLFFAGADKEYLTQCLNLLKQNLSNCIEALQRGSTPAFSGFRGVTRQISWSGIALCEAQDHSLVDLLASHLKKIQNPVDKGWSSEINEESNAFSTALALWFFSHAGDKWEEEKNDAIKWLLDNSQDEGWGWTREDPPNPAATAYALIALKKAGVKRSRKIQ